jgi:hypothetical protein
MGTIKIEAGLVATLDNTQGVATLQLIPIMVGSIYTHGKLQESAT